jgi:hypothetical protein
MVMGNEPQIIRRDNAYSVKKEFGEIYHCIVTNVLSDGRIYAHVPDLGSDIGPVLPLDTDATNKCSVGDTVVGTFITTAMTSFVVFGSSKSKNRSSILLFATEEEREISLGSVPSSSLFTYVSATENLEFWNGTVWKPIGGGGGGGGSEYAIGDTGPAGGVVFYNKGKVSDGWQYLEAAPRTWTTGNAMYQWRPSGTGNETIATCQNPSIGNGLASTNAIKTYIDNQGNGAYDYAAKQCLNLSFGGFDDWFLGSDGEMLQFVTAGVISDIYTEDNTYGYWTSTSLNSSMAITVSYWNGITRNTDVNRNNTFLVRPIRRF